MSSVRGGYNCFFFYTHFARRFRFNVSVLPPKIVCYTATARSDENVWQIDKPIRIVIILLLSLYYAVSRNEIVFRRSAVVQQFNHKPSLKLTSRHTSDSRAAIGFSSEVDGKALYNNIILNARDSSLQRIVYSFPASYFTPLTTLVEAVCPQQPSSRTLNETTQYIILVQFENGNNIILIYWYNNMSFVVLCTCVKLWRNKILMLNLKVWNKNILLYNIF